MAKRILCILSSLDRGGAETFMMKLYRSFDREKYQMDFAVNAHGAYDQEVLALGGRIHPIPLRTQHPVKSFLALKHLVKENKYTAVLKLGNAPLSVVDLIAAKLGGAKVLAMRSCNALTNLTAKQKILDFILRPVLNKTANVKLAPSDLAAIYTFGEKQFQKGNVHILHNGVDTNVYCYDAQARKEIRNEFSLDGKTVVGHIGRFSKQKNHALLLPVFAKIKEKDSNAKLVLVGTGELEGQIRTLAKELGISDDVIMTGVREDVPALLSAMDVLVLTSLYEGMPNTIIEAQATGLPCVISDTITRQADITGLVKFQSLDAPPEVWADEAIGMCNAERKNTKEDFLQANYDIDSVRALFLDLLYGD